MIGRTVSHYRIVEKLGAGGMGIVYKAEDIRLGRHVALKFLPDELVEDNEALARFRREARAASALNHPHICTIHDIEESEKPVFIVLEFLEGRTLAELIAGKALPVEQIIDLGIQVADALDAAHSQGVIHRDIKPQNIFVSQAGQAKVLDFGLAKLTVRNTSVDQAGNGIMATLDTITTCGTVLGTIAYMSPEQARGDETDARTDLFSFGAVLHEMASGQPAFSGATPAVIYDAIMNRSVKPASPLNDRVSRGLQEIIDRALERDRDLRYQTAADMRADLRRLARAISAPPPIEKGPPAVKRRQVPRRPSAGSARRKPIRSVAVLPLADYSTDSPEEYFADGMTEALIADLAKINALRVISRTSIMRYKGTAKSLPDVAVELGVDAVVEGSVLRAGSRVRITVQLIHAATDTHLWAESYERELQDVLILQSEVAGAIARAIRIVISGEDRNRLETSRRVNPEAYDACLKGRYYWYKLSREHLDAAERYYELALSRDPDCAPAHAGLGNVLIARADLGLLAPGEASPRAIAHLTKALMLDDSLVEVHVSLGNCRFTVEWAWTEAEAEFAKAIQLNPNHADAHFFYSDLLISMLRMQEAAAQASLALEMDPFNSFYQAFFGWHLVYRKRYEEALVQLRKSRELEPNFPATHMGIWGALYMKGEYDDALGAARSFFGLIGDAELEGVLTGAGESGYRAAMSRAAEIMTLRPAHIPAVRAARLFAHAGNHERALDWLEKAFERREPPLVHLPVAWDWDRLRSEPRFDALLRRMRFPLRQGDFA